MTAVIMLRENWFGKRARGSVLVLKKTEVFRQNENLQDLKIMHKGFYTDYQKQGL